MRLKIAGVIGGGAWGTALAASAARAGLITKLWALEEDVCTAINETRENSIFLKGVPLPAGISASSDYAHLKDADFVLMVCPSQFMRPVSTELIKHIRPETPLIICAKGIEKASGKLMSEVLSETAPAHPLAVLSGPTFASETARDLPTAMTLACKDPELVQKLAESLGRPTFRTYTTHDIIGAQIGGAVKNALAIACGIVEGREMGENARAALITRGLAEMLRFADFKGAEHQTLMGLCGLGDLILTCSSPQSRNMSLGMALGQGRTMDEVMAERKTVAEGVYNAEVIHRIAHKAGISMPIVETVYNILHQDMDVGEGIAALLERPLGKEF